MESFQLKKKKKLLLWIFRFFLTDFLLLVPSIQAKDIRYCTNRSYPVKITGVTISPDPVLSGNPATFSFYASTEQMIVWGEVVIDVSFYGFHIHSEKHNLCDETPCPISAGDFVLSHTQVLPVFAPPGSYSLKMKLVSKDGRQLSCVGFDFTIRYQRLVSDS